MSFLKKVLWQFLTIISGIIALIFFLFCFAAYSQDGFGAGFVFAVCVTVIFSSLSVVCYTRYRHFKGNSPALTQRHSKSPSAPQPQKTTTQPVIPELLQTFGLDGVTFGDNEPTVRQFIYAYQLGIDLRGKITFESVSRAIDMAKANPQKQKRRSIESAGLEQAYDLILARSPASKNQLQEIKEAHGQLPRAVNRQEADKIIEFLSELVVKCPYCKKGTDANLPFCLSCEQSLSKMKIPVSLDEK